MRSQVSFGSGCTEIISDSEAYPRRLDLLSDPPQKLFVQGRIPQGVMVAVVGSRDADPSMRRFAMQLATDLSARGIIVISGGAAGIDTAAHEGALEAGGRTVAILGAGLDHPYPRENTKLFERIRETGALVTEFEPATPPARWTFPRRNRIVAAMATAVIVVQASKRSGALITAKDAMKIDVPVGAVPFPPSESRGRGCNGLIKGGAALIEDVADVLNMISGRAVEEQLRLPTMESRGKETPSMALEALSDEEAAVLGRLSATPAHIDDIAARADLTAASVAAVLTSLELAGLVEDLGGKVFVRMK